MATKKPTAITKHKTATARKPTKPAQPQAFDIIPKSKVRPSATSRPVITSSTPVVADNTLTASTGAPTLQIKRRSIVINPSDDTDLSKEDVMPSLAPAATVAGATGAAQPTSPEAVSATATEAPQVQEGVAVGDLIAKRASVKGTESPATASVSGSDPESEPESPSEATTTVPAESSPGTTPELPIAEQGHVDDQAAAEAARLLSDELEAAESVAPEPESDLPAESAPEATVPTMPVPGTAGGSEAETTAQPVTAAAEPVALAAEPTLEPQQQSTELEAAVKHEESESSDPVAPVSGPEKTDTVPAANDALQEVLKEETVEPQEHSQAFKDAMKDMEGREVTEGKADKTAHHELYGGKPVIVVHKEHGSMSALAWVLWFFLCLGLAVLIVNFLLDAGFIETTYRIPHTNIL